jgi:hypothetical protein
MNMVFKGLRLAYLSEDLVFDSIESFFQELLQVYGYVFPAASEMSHKRSKARYNIRRRKDAYASVIEAKWFSEGIAVASGR